ncbi:MAG TPA: carboxypeptidase-like regulatory domain-containing protein [Gemmataceae bacterium]|jgi:hypothetical protein|nr:carboxypeptidase-like regulatory domain-containing protein [Gemmataceae bacterium]
MSRSSLAALALCFLIATGCGPSKGYPVSGKVLVNGQPAAGAIVVLTPVSNPGTMDKKPSGMTKEDGTFELMTFKEGDGAPPGDYLVSIIWPGKPKSSGTPKGLSGGEDERASSTDQLRGKYSDPQNSGLTVKIEAKANQLQPFDLKN